MSESIARDALHQWVSPVDKRLALPAWAQVERDLRLLIDHQRTLTIGDQLPTEKDLAVLYDVSRITVRQALAALADAGYVERRQGSGTFIADPPRPVQHELGLASPWRDRLRSAGDSADSVLLADVPVEEQPEELVRMIREKERSLPKLHLKRVHAVNGHRIGVTDSWLVGQSADVLRGVPLVDGSVSKTLAAHGVRLTSFDNVLSVRGLTSAEAAYLDAAPETPAFVDWSVERMGDALAATSRTVWHGVRVRFHYRGE